MCLFRGELLAAQINCPKNVLNWAKQFFAICLITFFSIRHTKRFICFLFENNLR